MSCLGEEHFVAVQGPAATPVPAHQVEESCQEPHLQGGLLHGRAAQPGAGWDTPRSHQGEASALTLQRAPPWARAPRSSPPNHSSGSDPPSGSSDTTGLKAPGTSRLASFTSCTFLVVGKGCNTFWVNKFDSKEGAASSRSVEAEGGAKCWRGGSGVRSPTRCAAAPALHKRPSHARTLLFFSGALPPGVPTLALYCLRTRQGLRFLGALEAGLSLLPAGARAPRRFAQVPLALGNEVQDRLIICVHDRALLGRAGSALGSGVARSFDAEYGWETLI